MALDKHKILHELSSVMNQLRSADCGCMGKLFSNPGGDNAPVCGNASAPVCGTATAPVCDNAFSENSGCAHRHGRCHGFCNPTKLYADTYNYLNSNMMQPVVKEVYNDLNTLTPANTVMNNPIANEMGVTPCFTSAQVSSNRQGDSSGLVGNQIMGNTTNNTNSQIPENFKGMGPQIVNMIMKEDSPKQSNILGQSSPIAAPMTANNSKFSHSQVVNDSRSPHGQIDNKHLTPPSDTYQYGTKIKQRNDGLPMQNYFQYSMQNQPNSQQINKNPNSTNPQISNVHNQYGQHSQAINKFNEIFPGVMQGVGGDLGFDPMTIAVQMNPANQQKAAMDTMQKFMYGNNGAIQPSGNANNATIPPIVHPDQNIHSPQIQNITNEQLNQQFPPSQPTPAVQGGTEVPVINQNSNEQKKLPQYQHTPQVLRNQYGQPLEGQQEIVHPNSEAVMPDKLSADETDGFHTTQMKKEQIFPVDTSKFDFHPVVTEYNTLGQPVEKQSAKMYRPMEPPLPQTLSPQDEQQRFPSTQKCSNVKSTVSKTSIMGNRRASRTLLQQVYNQSKSAHSVAHQNLRVPGVVSLSEGKLAPQTEVVRQVPLERVGGDIVVNIQNQSNTTSKINENINRKGDKITSNKPYGDIIPEKVIPTGKQSRNGIQDMTYPAYSMSSAWSFQRPIRVPYYETCRNRY